MNSIRLRAKNARGDVAQFILYESDKQYSVGGEGDISLRKLDVRKQLYSRHAFITYIDGCWYIRSAKGHRAGKRALKVDGRLINSSAPELRIQHGAVISFGVDDDIVMRVEEDSIRGRSVRDTAPQLSGLLDQAEAEFEKLNEELRQFFGLGERAKTDVIWSKLLKRGLLDEAYLYNCARGLRNIIAHRSLGAVPDKHYVNEALRSIELVRSALQNLKRAVNE